MKLEPGVPEEVGMSSPRVRRVADNIRRWVDQGHQQAIVAMVARKGVVVMRESAGRMTPEADSPVVGPDTAFPLCSITKPILATAAMILVEEGELDIHFPVAYFIPEFTGEGKNAVTIFHLMTHTSGLREEDLNEYAKNALGSAVAPPADGAEDPTVSEYLKARYSAPLWKPPGQEMAYADYNYRLLGEVIRRVSGMSLPDFIAARVFRPLGMSGSYLAHLDCCIYPISPLAKTPCPGWVAFSTAVDMTVFGQMFLNKGSYGDARIIGPLTVAGMTRNRIPGVKARYGEEVFPEAGWGLGWSIVGSKNCEDSGEPLLSSETFCHGGAGGGHLWVDPLNQLVAVYLSIALERIPGRRLGSCRGLFINSVMAAVEE